MKLAEPSASRAADFAFKLVRVRVPFYAAVILDNPCSLLSDSPNLAGQSVTHPPRLLVVRNETSIIRYGLDIARAMGLVTRGGGVRVKYCELPKMKSKSNRTVDKDHTSFVRQPTTVSTTRTSTSCSREQYRTGQVQ